MFLWLFIVAEGHVYTHAKTLPMCLCRGCLRKGLPLLCLVVILVAQVVEVGFQVPLLSSLFVWMSWRLGPMLPLFVHLSPFLCK